MAATAPKTKRPARARRAPRPRREYVVVNLATEDTDVGTAAAEAWLSEAEKR